MKVYIATAEDGDEGHRILGVFKEKDTAAEFIRSDIENYCDIYGIDPESDDVDFEERTLNTDENTHQWYIVEETLQ